MLGGLSGFPAHAELNSCQYVKIIVESSRLKKHSLNGSNPRLRIVPPIR